MDINDLIENFTNIINRFSDEVAEKQIQQKMSPTGRGPDDERINLKV